MEGSASMIPILQTNKKTTTNKNITQQPPYKNAAVALMDTSVELPAVKNITHKIETWNLCKIGDLGSLCKKKNEGALKAIIGDRVGWNFFKKK